MTHDIEELHAAACEAKKSFYIDPITKLYVFTSYHLSQRPCCGCGCRHCPHSSKKTNSTSRLLNIHFDDLPESIDILFWSGGKDSYLALRKLRKENTRPILLLTTYDHHTSMVAHQNVSIDDIEKQTKAINLPLLAVPIVKGEYVQSCQKAINRIRDHGVDVYRIAFGDLHLRHIRQWRESHLNDLGHLYYPIWNVSYDQLLTELSFSGVTIKVTAVENGIEGVKVGDFYNEQFANNLPSQVDKFGENGEFHTFVELWKGETT